MQGPVNARDNDFDDDVFFARNNSEDIARVRAEGFEVDDDNDPAPENVPQLFDNPTVTDAGLYKGQTWGWNGMDRRVMEGGNYNGPLFANGWIPTGKIYMDVFLHLFCRVADERSRRKDQRWGGQCGQQAAHFW